MASVKSYINWRYLALEAGLFLLLSYLVLLGGTYNGVILFALNQVNFILILILGFAWMAWRFWRNRTFLLMPLSKPLLVLTAVGLLVTAFSVDPRRSAITFVQLLFYILLFYCLVDLLQAGLEADLLIKVWLLTSLVVMIFSIIQIVFWYKSWIDLAGWQHLIPSNTIRISAFLGHPNIMAAYFNLLLPLGILRAFQSGSRVGRVGWSIWALTVIGLIFFTSSRGGWLGTTTILVILAGLWAISNWANLKKKFVGQRRNGLAVVLSIVLVGLVFVGYILLKWQSKNPTHAGSGLDFMSREYIWQVAWQTFKAHPLVGNGPFTFGTQFIQTVSVPTGMLLSHAHNFLFNIAAEAGIVGLAAFGWVIVSFFIIAWKKWQVSDQGNRLVLIGLCASLGGLAVHSLFDTPELLPLIGIMIVSFTALVVASERNEPCLVETKLVHTTGIPPRIYFQSHRQNIFLLAIWLVITCLCGWSLWAYQPAFQGVVAANSGDWPAAAKSFELASTRDPRFAFNWFQAGFSRGELALGSDGSLKDANMLNQAISDYQYGMILEPVYATNWANLGLLEWASGDYSAALKDLKKAVVTAPEQPAFKLTYGRMLEMDERPDEAKIVYRQVLDSVPSWASTYFFRASPLRLAVIKKWRSETNPQENNEVIAPSPTSIEISGFGLANNESIANNNLALGISLTQQGDFKDAITAIKSGLDLFDQTTSFGVGQMGNSQYGWSIFNRESIDADILSGLDYPVYTDDVVKMMLVLADDYQKIGDKVSASQVYEKILRVAPDCQPAIEKLK